MNFARAIEWLVSGQEIRRTSWNTLSVVTLESCGMVAWDDGVPDGAPKIYNPAHDDFSANDWAARKPEKDRSEMCVNLGEAKIPTVRIDPPAGVRYASSDSILSDVKPLDPPSLYKSPPSASVLKHREEMGKKLDNWFMYHAPTPEQRVSYETIRHDAKHFARTIVNETPPGADQSAALRLLRECVMTANQSIACDGK